MTRAAVLGVVLAAVSGSVDVLAITRLGGAFASVITGNVVVAGVSIGRADTSALVHAAVAVVLYAAGVGVGAALTRHADDSERTWSPRVTLLCAAELVLLLLVGVLWVVSDANPRGTGEYLALAGAAAAMGVQTAAFRLVAVAGVTTTYFTGTLTGLISGLIHNGRWNNSAALALLALLAGATLGGVLIAHAAPWAVAAPLGLLAVVVSLGSFFRRRWPGAPPPAEDRRDPRR